MTFYQRVLSGAAWFGALGLAWASGCGSSDVTTDACSKSASDCAAMPGTLCLESQCMCVSSHDMQWCKGACRPAAECMPGGGSGGYGAGGAGGAGSTGSAGGGGGVVAQTCVTSDDCDKPDPKCGTVSCVGGVCKKKVVIGPTPSQIRGDCQTVECDSEGALVVKANLLDPYNDGRQCTQDYCITDAAGKGVVVSQPFANSVVCPETNKGTCYNGECTDCIDNMVGCQNMLACDYTTCVPLHCRNNVFEQALGETSMDCGGPCRPCLTGQLCLVGADCVDHVCMNGNCKPPSCMDGVKNDAETGVDCGGSPNCPVCPTGQGCDLPADCESKSCWAGICQPPTCLDGIMNGPELGVDCGGPCAHACE